MSKKAKNGMPRPQTMILGMAIEKDQKECTLE
jgi:hypothetical protein